MTANPACGCGSTRIKIVKRAVESAGWPDAWDGEHVVECRECGQRRLDP